MKISIHSNYLRSDKILFYGHLLSFLFFIATIGMILVFYRQLPLFVPLYNQLPWGEARLGGKNEFFILPAIVGGVLFINLFFALFLYPKIPLLSRMFAIASLLNAFFGFLFVIRTILLIV